MTDPIQFTETSPRFALPFLFVGQAQKEFFVNEAFARADLALHCAIEGEASAPPTSANDGECWLIAETATGGWEGRDHSIAGRQAGSWMYFDPLPGMRIWDKSAEQYIVYNDGWQKPTRPAEPSPGTTEDTQLRSAFSELLEALAIAGIISVA